MGLVVSQFSMLEKHRKDANDIYSIGVEVQSLMHRVGNCTSIYRLTECYKLQSDFRDYLVIQACTYFGYGQPNILYTHAVHLESL